MEALKFKSRQGDMWVAAKEGAIIGAYFVGQKYEADIALFNQNGVVSRALLNEAKKQLIAYFQNDLTEFDLPLRLEGTAFQKAVWQRIATIPFGERLTYGELAAHVGSPSAARAAGAATGRNPISVIIPCHRVLGASGALTGYAGGIDRKRFLLSHEPAAELA